MMQSKMSKLICLSLNIIAQVWQKEVWDVNVEKEYNIFEEQNYIWQEWINVKIDYYH